MAISLTRRGFVAVPVMMAVLLSHQATGQTAGDDGARQVPLYGTLGLHTRTVSTVSDSAQAYFNQGMQFMYAFGTGAATRSFREAQRYDPGCAMCYYGEAWSLSPYLNGRMSLQAEREAYRAILAAGNVSPNATDVERGLIGAMSVRFAENPTAETRRELDSLYSNAMADMVDEFPEDLDAATLYAESLMLLRPRRGSVDLEDPLVQGILAVLEGVLVRDLHHPGACHLYIHLVEASPDPGRAEQCADHLGDAIPGASHIRHMPSHIYVNIGRYSDAVRANQNAWHVDQQAEYGGPPGIYPSHNLHMLLFAATLDGQSAVAIQAAKDLAVVNPGWAFYHPLVLATFGRWSEILQLQGTYEDALQEGMWRYARGMAHLRTGDDDAARTNLWLLHSIIERLPDSLTFRFHRQNTLLSIPAGILEGEILAAAGDYERAIDVLERTVLLEDGLVYDEPEPWHHPVRHVLGAVLLEAGQFSDAERVYREALEDNAHTGWALFGLEQALRSLGKDQDADWARSEYERRWDRRDIWLRSSRF